MSKFAQLGALPRLRNLTIFREQNHRRPGLVTFLRYRGLIVSNSGAP